jgi:hypothetical protein
MLIAPPGVPEEEVTFTPATLPCNACSGLVKDKFLICEAFTVQTEPVMSFFFCVP